MSNELLTSLDSVCSTAQSLHASLRLQKTPLKNRTKLLKSLDDLQTVAQACSDLSTTVRKKPRSVKKMLSRVINGVSALSYGIQDSELTFTETKHTYVSAVMPAIAGLSASASSLRDRIKSDEIIESKSDAAYRKAIKEAKLTGTKNDLRVAKYATEERDRVAEEEKSKLRNATKTRGSKKLSTYKSYESSLLVPKSEPYRAMVERGTTLPVVCPIFVSFSVGRMRDLDVLDQLGFKYTVISSLNNEDIADVALVLEDQILLQFSKKAAKVYFDNRVATMRKEIKDKPEQKTLRAKRKELKALMVKQAGLEKAALSKSSKQNAMATNSLQKIIGQVEQLESEIDKLTEDNKRDRHKITLLQREVFQTSNVRNADQSKRTILKPKAIDQYLGQILNAFGSVNHHYSMLSNQYEKHPNIADVQLAWLVPHEQAVLIRELFGDMNIVANWGLPWKVHGGK